MTTNTTALTFSEMNEWKYEYISLFWALHLVAVEILQHAIVMNVGKVQARKIDIRGGHLDEFSSKDKAFIIFNRLCVPLLTYFTFRFCWLNPQHVEWDMNKLTLGNTVGAMVLFFALYDFIYTLFHRALHIRGMFYVVPAHNVK